MSSNKPLRVSNRRIVHELYITMVSIVVGTTGFCHHTEPHRISERLSTLKRLLKLHGPFRTERFAQLQNGRLRVLVGDVSKEQNAAFDLGAFESLCRSVDAVSKASESHRRHHTDDTERALDEAEKVFDADEIKAIRKIAVKLQEKGGFEIAGKDTGPVAIGPIKSPLHVRQTNRPADMEIFVVSLEEVQCLMTTQGEFLLPLDAVPDGLHIGERGMAMIEEGDSRVYSLVAAAAEPADNQLEMDLALHGVET
jgi:hypothetical protein